MKVWELMSILSRMEAGKNVVFSTLFSKIGEGNRLIDCAIDGAIDIGDCVMLMSEERSSPCLKE